MFGDGNIRCPYINSPWNATALREKQVPHMQDPMAKKNTHTRIPTAERATTMYNFWKTLNIMLSVALTFYINTYIPVASSLKFQKKTNWTSAMYVVKEAIENIKIAVFFSCFFCATSSGFFFGKSWYIYSKYVFFSFLIAQSGKSETQISARWFQPVGLSQDTKAPKTQVVSPTCWTYVGLT